MFFYYSDKALRQFSKLDKAIQKEIKTYTDNLESLENPRTKGKALKANLKGLEDIKKNPHKYKDHALKGNLKGIRDCHIRPDLILLYEKNNNELILTALRIGKHSELGLSNDR